MEFPKKINKILYDPAPRLRAPNELVTEPWEYLEGWTRKMFKLMYEVNGVGLSACQVGWNVQLFVMNPDKEGKSKKQERVYWNPRRYGTQGAMVVYNEGCLSLPKVFGNVKRFPGIVLHAMTPQGEKFEHLTGFAAHIVQHELDHMVGQLCWEKFTDEPITERKGTGAAPAGQSDAAAPPVA